MSSIPRGRVFPTCSRIFQEAFYPPNVLFPNKARLFPPLALSFTNGRQITNAMLSARGAARRDHVVQRPPCDWWMSALPLTTPKLSEYFGLWRGSRWKSVEFTSLKKEISPRASLIIYIGNKCRSLKMHACVFIVFSHYFCLLAGFKIRRGIRKQSGSWQHAEFATRVNKWTDKQRWDLLTAFLDSLTCTEEHCE